MTGVERERERLAAVREGSLTLSSVLAERARQEAQRAEYERSPEARLPDHVRRSLGSYRRLFRGQSLAFAAASARDPTCPTCGKNSGPLVDWGTRCLTCGRAFP